MKKPVLVIMAAGMGSRYGGLKQIDPIDDQGHIIMDFSIFDAKRAGFEKVVFIIKKENVVARSRRSFRNAQHEVHRENLLRIVAERPQQLRALDLRGAHPANHRAALVRKPLAQI